MQLIPSLLKSYNRFLWGHLGYSIKVWNQEIHSCTSSLWHVHGQAAACDSWPNPSFESALFNESFDPVHKTSLNDSFTIQCFFETWKLQFPDLEWPEGLLIHFGANYFFKQVNSGCVWYVLLIVTFNTCYLRGTKIVSDLPQENTCYMRKKTVYGKTWFQSINKY